MNNNFHATFQKAIRNHETNSNFRPTSDDRRLRNLTDSSLNFVPRPTIRLLDPPYYSNCPSY